MEHVDHLGAGQTCSICVPFACGLERDRDAVTTALTCPFHNGGTEGVINKTKLIKRQVYGRARFTPSPPSHPLGITSPSANTASETDPLTGHFPVRAHTSRFRGAVRSGDSKRLTSPRPWGDYHTPHYASSRQAPVGANGKSQVSCRADISLEPVLGRKPFVLSSTAFH